MKTFSMIKSLICISVLLLITTGIAFGASVGEVTYVKGKVELLKSGMKSVKPVRIGDPIGVGDILSTKGKSNAEINFNNENVLRLAASTKVEIKEYTAQPDHVSVIIKMHSGTVQAVSAPEDIKQVPSSGNR